MRTFLRPRYGCDYCKKVGGSKHHMAKHEAGCTANPNRVCKLHKFATGDEEAPTMAELIEAQREGGYKQVCEVARHCPACKLATFRQGVLATMGLGDEESQERARGWDEFSFSTEMASVWSEYNLAREEGLCG